MTSPRQQEKQSFIAEARRAQIVDAAIQTLDEIGYVQASLAQIAKRAEISTALISYHFSDKDDLMNHVLIHLLEQSTAYVLERIRQHAAPQAKLEAFILASLAYQGTHPAHNSALLEILFNSRMPDKIPYYKLDDDEEEPLRDELRKILAEGQEQGVFGGFHISVMASLIQGAIGEYMLSKAVTKNVDLEAYSSELIRIVRRSVRQE